MLHTAESLREAIRNQRFTWEDCTFRRGCSIGFVPITAENEDVASVLLAADFACGAAKESGRNRVHCLEESRFELLLRIRDESHQEKETAMSLWSRLFGTGKRSTEFGGYRTQSEKEAWAKAMVGAQFMTERNYRDALAISEQALAKSRRCKEAWVVKAGALTMLNRPEDAFACYSEALALDPSYGQALDQRALLLEHFPALSPESAGDRRG